MKDLFPPMDTSDPTRSSSRRRSRWSSITAASGQTDEASRAGGAAHSDKADYTTIPTPGRRENGLDKLSADAERVRAQSRELYTAEMHGDSRWKARRPVGAALFEAWPRAWHPDNIHVHKGPTIRPLDRDSFDGADV